MNAAATKPKSQPKPRLTVAEYITAQLDLCGKSQMEIAREAGFGKPNIITMIKQGKTKLPMSKIGPIAASMGIDPLHLFQLCMAEYDPDTWESINKYVLKQPFVSANELEIIELLRTSKVTNPKLRTIEEKQRLLTAFNTLRPDNAVAGD